MSRDGMSGREATTYFQIGDAGAVGRWRRMYAQGGACVGTARRCPESR